MNIDCGQDECQQPLREGGLSAAGPLPDRQAGSQLAARGADCQSAAAGPLPDAQAGNQRRQTRQRQVILEELQAVTSHPTAVELHELVRRRLPRVSLGTVYRNLDLLNRMGLVEKLEYSGGDARFDGNTAQHDHLRCVRCGRVDDALAPPLELAPLASHDLRGYEVIGHRLEFIGICPRCRQESEAKLASAADVIPGSEPTTSGESEDA